MRVELNNTTKKLCVIGDPVLHSKSPLIQNTMLAALGLDYLYLCQPVARGRTADWLACAKLAGYAGFNATMPHKEALVPLMDELDEDARMYGSVNAVCIRDGRTLGCNTDGRGFLRALEDEGLSVPGARVTLLGAGGAAKAVALKLAAAGAARVTVCNRTAGRAEALCRHDPAVMVPTLFDRESLRRAASECDLLVNCTSMGMTGSRAQFEDLSFLEALPAAAAVCDVIYAPAETALLAEARRRGHQTMNGLGMLVYQAVFSLELFTGQALDTSAMGPLVKSALQDGA